MLHTVTKLVGDLYFPDQPCGRYGYGVEEALSEAGFTVPTTDDLRADNTAEKPVMHFCVKAEGIGFQQVYTLVKRLSKYTDCTEAWFQLIAPFFPENFNITTMEIVAQKMHWYKQILTDYALTDAVWQRLKPLPLACVKPMVDMLYDLEFDYDSVEKHSPNHINPMFFKYAQCIIPRPELREQTIHHAAVEASMALRNIGYVNIDSHEVASVLKPLIESQVDRIIDQEDKNK